METALSLPISTELLIPHRPPVRLVERLVEFTGQSGTTEAAIEEASIFVGEGGRVIKPALVELLAQSSAALKGYSDLSQGKPIQRGFLVSVKKVKFIGNAFSGDKLFVKVRFIGEFDGFTVAEGEVIRQDEVIASGTITLWIPEGP